ncbi:MAG: hypothetical protein JRI73_12045 [Deltaproteobacteria bacterium]|nr:hypothetical protein [Deltaproteobacteria bacterium]
MANLKKGGFMDQYSNNFYRVSVISHSGGHSRYFYRDMDSIFFDSTSHVGMFVIKWKYNPGFFISAFLNIPVGVFTVWYFYSNDVISIFGHLIGILVAVAVQGGLMVWGLKFMRTKVKEKSAARN